MKKFQFVNPLLNDNKEKNWEHLNSNIACQEYNPFTTWDITNEFPGADSAYGVYATFGPIVYFSITLVGAAITWGNGSAMSLPIAIATRKAAETQQYGLSFPLMVDEAFLDNGFGAYQHFGTNTGTTLFAAFNGGPVDEFNISGWYFR